MPGEASRLRTWPLTLAVMFCAAAALFAQDGIKKRIHFARGRTSAIERNSVVRGTRNQYLVGAEAGQTMTVSITSVEHNAVFAIMKPGGGYLPNASDESDATKWTGRLPTSGDYTIEVGGTRGNAQYALSIGIK